MELHHQTAKTQKERLVELFKLFCGGSLPISASNLVAVYVTPTVLAGAMKAIGNISTSNYVYYVSVDNKFSFLDKRSMISPKEEFDDLRKKYLLSMSYYNTNAALKLAERLLSAASMDVSSLNRDCQVEVRAWTPEGPNGNYFVPLYWVLWFGAKSKLVASVEILEPTRTLRSMRVKESKYILRKPLQIFYTNTSSGNIKNKKE